MKMRVMRVAGYSVLCFGAAVVVFNFAAPKAPSTQGGLGGKYYNLVYSLTACRAAVPLKYEQDGVAFDYFSNNDVRGMERHSGFSMELPPLERALPGYTQDYSYPAGNIWMNSYVPGKKGPATAEQLLALAGEYAQREGEAKPEISMACVKGAPFSACFRSGHREGVCFTSRSGRVYCLADQDLSMQGGRYPFWETFSCSVFGSGCVLSGYNSSGFKAWFARPAREKLSDCNFREIMRTLAVKGEK